MRQMVVFGSLAGLEPTGTLDRTGGTASRSRGAANLPGHECIRNEDTSTSANGCHSCVCGALRHRWDIGGAVLVAILGVVPTILI